MVFLLLFIYITIGAIHGPGLVKSKQYKELAVFLTLLCIALLYSCGQVYDWHLPKPDDLIGPVFNLISSYIFGEHY